MRSNLKSFYQIAITSIFSALLIVLFSSVSVAQTGHEGHSHSQPNTGNIEKGHDHSGHDHSGHNHDHSGHDHSGHNHAQPQTKTKVQTKGQSHQGHSHSAGDGHNHSHDGHDHSGHDHSGHSHGNTKTQTKKHITTKKSLQGNSNANAHAGHNHKDGHSHKDGHDHDHGCHCASTYHYAEDFYDPVATAMHHIADANEFHLIGDTHLPLPVMLYAPDQGWTTCMSSKFHHGCTAYDTYVLVHGRVKRVLDRNFPKGEVSVCIGEKQVPKMKKGKPVIKNDKQVFEMVPYVEYNGKQYNIENSSIADAGLFGGGLSSFYDFSITKNVFTMMLASLFLMFIFFRVAKAYKNRAGQAPSGLQAFMEPFFVFMSDEVCKPMMGDKYEKFQPFIMTIFFFILVCNLMGLIPFFPGSANVTGNLAVTMALAIIAFVVTNINGNRHYWEHVLWMPGIPWWVKVFVLTPVEILGLFIKPFSLMIRLFANITAGHIIILSLVGLIFIFGKNGTYNPGAAAGAVMGSLFTAFMNLIELIVAFLQAFIFSILTASYIGAATEDGHHDDEHGEHAAAH